MRSSPASFRLIVALAAPWVMRSSMYYEISSLVTSIARRAPKNGFRPHFLVALASALSPRWRPRAFRAHSNACALRDWPSPASCYHSYSGACLRNLVTSFARIGRGANNPAEQVPKPQNHDEKLAQRIHRHDSQVIDIADVRCFDGP